MTDVERAEPPEAARTYEELHVPALFAEWTEPVLDAAGVREGHRVLDVACGTGVLARSARRRVGPSGSVHGLDPNRGMLALAEWLEPGVEWCEGVAESLPFDDGAFDRVVSQFGLMFVPDPVAAIREMLRVLAPGGRMSVAVWDALERSPAYSVEVEILQRVAGTAAADALRAPFALGDPEELRALFDRAGAEGAAVESHVGTARFPTVRVMVEADLRGWLPVMGVHLDEDEIAHVLSEAERALAPFVDGHGRAVFDSPAHIVTGAKAAT